MNFEDREGRERLSGIDIQHLKIFVEQKPYQSVRESAFQQYQIISKVKKDS